MEAWTLSSDSMLPNGRKTRALLGLIALMAPRPVLRSRISEMLWSRRPEEQARASLRQEIHRLLAALDPFGPDVLDITRDHVGIRPGAIWLDVDEMLRATPARSATLSLFDGELMEDLDGVDPAFDAWLAGERERLRDRARALGEALLAEQTEPDEMIVAAQRLLGIDRSHEQAWRALMRAYAVRGDRGMAIQVYDRCRAALTEQLDAEPSEETQGLLEDIKSDLTSRAGAKARRERPLADPQPTREAPRARPDSVELLLARQDPRAGQAPATHPAPPPARVAPAPLEPFHASIERPLPARRPGRAGLDQAAIIRANAAHGETEAAAAPVAKGIVRVGVLPLGLIGARPDEAHLATGLADDVTAALARYRWMFLVSSSALARFASQSRDETAIRHVFGLDLLLDGTIQRAGDRLRASIRLLDLRAGNQVVWSGQITREVDDPLLAQDEMAAEISARVECEILQIECQRAATARTGGTATPNELWLRSIPLLLRRDRPGFMEAGDLLTRAIALDPDHAAAHAWLALWHVFLFKTSWTDDAHASAMDGACLAERAILLDPRDGRVLTIAGYIRAFLERRPSEAMTLHDRALSLNPSLAMAWNLSALTCAFLGHHEEAERRVARYKHLTPLDPHAAFFDSARIVIALLRRRHEEAARIGREVMGMNPGFPSTLRPYLAVLGHLGEHREAAIVRARLLSQEPGFTVGRFLATSPFERAEDRNHYAEGFRLAGVPE